MFIGVSRGIPFDSHFDIVDSGHILDTFLNPRRGRATTKRGSEVNCVKCVIYAQLGYTCVLDTDDTPSFFAGVQLVPDLLD